ncbi:hypothetical protein BJX62DRAFT_213100 [Aspergillus germanicus]
MYSLNSASTMARLTLYFSCIYLFSLSELMAISDSIPAHAKPTCMYSTKLTQSQCQLVSDLTRAMDQSRLSAIESIMFLG